MCSKKTLFIGLALFATTALFSGCGALDYTGDSKGSIKIAIPPITVKSGGVLGSILSTLGLDLPFNQVIPQQVADSPQVTEVYLNTIAVRSTRSDDFDSNHQPINDNLIDENKVGECAQGQQPLSFIKTLEVDIQKDGDSKVVKIASYQQTPQTQSDCGFMMKIETDPATGKAYNLKQFLPKYTVTDKATGQSPSQDVQLTGYVGVDWIAPDVHLINNQPPQQ